MNPTKNTHRYTHTVQFKPIKFYSNALLKGSKVIEVKVQFKQEIPFNSLNIY